MSKVLKIIGMIAGAVALVATGLGAFGVIASKTATTIAAIAGVVGTAANIGAQLLARPPPARGSVTQVLIAADAPQPYVMGEGYFGGVLRHDAAWGATLNKVPNPYRFMATVYSGGGPIQSITPYVDQGAVPGWYSGYLYTDTQLGTQPESSALAPQWAGTPGWSASSKLSGQAAIGWSFLFDKDGKRFASGIPQLGAYGQWVKVYDPRLDDTFPGGSGAHRLGDESTYEWSENPALHAAMYAYGRFQNGVRTFGCGLPEDAIDWDGVAAWASVCDANAWTLFGVVYEPTQDTRWPNLKEICAAGGCVPILANGLLSFHYAAPKVALDTFTEDDLAEGSGKATAWTTWRERLNTIVPKYRSPDHNWELVAADDEVSVSTYVTEDGEVKKAEWPFNFVKDPNQAAELAAYRLVDGRELQPIELTFGHRVRAYRPGDCVHLDIPELGLAHDAIILKRTFDPEALTVTFTLVTETEGKHDFALGKTATPPPTPALGQTGQERDELYAATKDAVYELFNAQNDRNGDAIADPTIPGGGTAVDHVVRADGSIDMTFEWLWGGTNSTIDGFEVMLYGRTSASAYTPGTTPTDETRFLVPADQRAKAVMGLPANLYYTFAVRAYRWVDPDIDASGVIRSNWVKSTVSGENPYNVATSPGFVGDLQGTLNGGAATVATVVSAAANFNTRNDRTATTPTAPTVPTGGTCIDHTLNDDGSADISFEWNYGGSEPDIDAFEIMVRHSASASAYTAGTTAAEELITTAPPNKRVLFLRGVNPTSYFTFAVRSLRIVDPDVDSSGRKVSAWVQSAVSGENPYQPSANAAFLGDLLGTIDGRDASDVSGTVKPGGGVATDQVDTTAIVAGNVTDFTSSSMGSTLNGNGTTQTAISTNISMAHAGDLAAIVSASQSFPSGDRSWNIKLYIDGVLLHTSSGTKPGDSVSLAGKQGVSSGTRTVQVDWNGASGCDLTACQVVILRRYR